MKRGYLSQYFSGIAFKRLSKVEANPEESNQHEFNGVAGLRQILGEPDGKVTRNARFMYFNDLSDEPVVDEGFLTWYDAREKARRERGVNRQEYRLYFPGNAVSQLASQKDLLIIACLSDESLLAIVTEAGSTAEQQLIWLFGITPQDRGFSVRSGLDEDQDRIGFAARMILEQVGIEVDIEDQNHLEEMLCRFESRFPATIEFSAYARSTLGKVSSLDDPDRVLVMWMDREEVLFRTLERHLLKERLKDIIDSGMDDPDEVVRIVQSALQRRKSRAGAALENHLERIFSEHGITYTRTGVTENRLKPDFIFPGIAQYRDPLFPFACLTMLAAKSTCKDRWRQILNEAARIPSKHLLTLEPGISENQTDEMKQERVQLVIPAGLHSSYTNTQRQWLMDVKTFASNTLALQKGRGLTC